MAEAYTDQVHVMYFILVPSKIIIAQKDFMYEPFK